MVEAYKSRDELNHSRIFNVNRWSEYPEVNSFVNQIYDKHFSDLTKLRKHHLKVLLLDLYVCWYYDPDMCLAVHLNKNRYKKGSRYSALNIATKTIDVVKTLLDDGFIYWAKGYRFEDTESKITRIWPTDKLIKLFKRASFDVLAIAPTPDTETIILRDADKQNIEYEDTPTTIAMRKVIADYNALLERTYIDVANLTKPFIERKQKKKKGRNRKTKIGINQSNKRVHRVFNESFDRGGRFYGGFWSQIGSQHRRHIQLNGERVIEQDFSGWHIQLLYARRNINYFEKFGNQSDPYDVHVPEINDPIYCRWLVKNLILVAVNAKTETSAINAIQTMPTDEDVTRPEGLVLSNKLLKSILHKLKALHSDIAEDFCSGAGIELQNVDGEITNNLIKSFTEAQVPILTVHDSYIVPEKYHMDLWEEMQEQYKALLLRGGHVDADAIDSFDMGWAYTKVKQSGYYDEEMDTEEEGGGAKHLAILQEKDEDLIETTAYQRRYSSWLESDYLKWLTEKVT